MNDDEVNISLLASELEAIIEAVKFYRIHLKIVEKNMSNVAELKNSWMLQEDLHSVRQKITDKLINDNVVPKTEGGYIGKYGSII